MIFDHLDHAARYFPLSREIELRLRFLRESPVATLAAGTHEIDGRRVFAIVQEYLSKPPDQGFWESHRRYTDIQFVVSGVERIGCAQIRDMNPGPYDEEKDLIKHQGVGEWATVRAGFFLILWPHDVHQPQIMLTEPAPVRKIVVKAAV